MTDSAPETPTAPPEQRNALCVARHPAPHGWLYLFEGETAVAIKPPGLAKEYEPLYRRMAAAYNAVSRFTTEELEGHEFRYTELTPGSLDLAPLETPDAES